MKKLAFLALAFPVLSAYAADLSPGRWEITMVSKVPADAGWAPPPFKLNQCVTAADAADPSRLVSSLAVPGATGCEYDSKSYVGNTFHFSLSCSGSFGLKVRGSVVFSAGNFAGEMWATGQVTEKSDKATDFKNQISAVRTGAC